MRDAPKTHLVTENAGRLQGRTAVHLDVPAAERQRRERELKTSEIRYRRLFETSPYGILVLDAETGVVVDVNPSMCRMLGYESNDLLYQPLWSIGAFKNAAATKNQFGELLRQPHVRYDGMPIEKKDGQVRHVELVSTMFLADKKPFVQCTIRDVTDRIKREREDSERAQDASSRQRAPRRSTDRETTDDTTGLATRWYFEDSLPRQLHRAERARTPVTITALVFDREQPDAMLREIGRVIREHLRKSDMAARYSSKEFVLSLDASPDAAAQRVDELRQAIGALELYHGQDRLTPPAVRAGTATAGRDGTTAAELLDAACAAARRAR